MGILILPPSFEEVVPASSPENEDSDSDGDASMLGGGALSSKGMKLASNNTVVPGETITDESQWMRYTWPQLYLLIKKTRLIILSPPAATAPTTPACTPP